MNLVYFFEQKLVTRHICVQDIDSQSFVVWRVENPTRHISVANLMRDELKRQLVTLQYVDYQKVKPLCDEWWVFRKNIFSYRFVIFTDLGWPALRLLLTEVDSAHAGKSYPFVS